jgi:hypothetical protein
MASEQAVKQYLAYWFQLGKLVMLRGGQETLRPQSVLQGNRYSPEFEACWVRIRQPASGECHLQGTSQTIAELLTPQWDIELCSRCALLVPVRNFGLPPVECPCSDLPTWPNTELPPPRLPISTEARLQKIRDRLSQPSPFRTLAESDSTTAEPSIAEAPALDAARQLPSDTADDALSPDSEELQRLALQLRSPRNIVGPKI